MARGQKDEKSSSWFAFFVSFFSFFALVFFYCYLKKGATFNFTLRKLIVWRAVVFVPSGVENNTPSQHREILLPEISRCRLALHPFCRCVKPWDFFVCFLFSIHRYCTSRLQYCALTTDTTTEFVVACCVRAITHARRCCTQGCRVHLSSGSGKGRAVETGRCDMRL